MTRPAARRSPPRAMPPRRCPATAGCSGWREGAPSGPLEELLAAVRATVYARDESGGQEAGYGLETEAAQLDGAFVELAQAAQAALAELRSPLIRLGRAARGDAGRTARLARRPGPRADRRRAPFARLADRSARRVGGAARPARRPGRSRIRRLARGRALRCARIRCRPPPPLARSDEAVRRDRARTRARGDADLGDAVRRDGGDWDSRGGPQRRAAPRRRAARCPASTARSTMPRRPKC